MIFKILIKCNLPKHWIYIDYYRFYENITEGEKCHTSTFSNLLEVVIIGVVYNLRRRYPTLRIVSPEACGVTLLQCCARIIVQTVWMKTVSDRRLRVFIFSDISSLQRFKTLKLSSLFAHKYHFYDQYVRMLIPMNAWYTLLVRIPFLQHCVVSVFKELLSKSLYVTLPLVLMYLLSLITEGLTMLKFILYSLFLMKRLDEGLDVTSVNEWDIGSLPHAKQLDGSSCGVYVLKVDCLFFNELNILSNGIVNIFYLFWILWLFNLILSARLNNNQKIRKSLWLSFIGSFGNFEFCYYFAKLSHAYSPRWRPIFAISMISNERLNKTESQLCSYFWVLCFQWIFVSWRVTWVSSGDLSRCPICLVLLHYLLSISVLPY